MFVGVARITLLIPGALSLKEKRSVLRRLKDRLRDRVACAVAEVGAQDEWQRAEIGVTVISDEHRFSETLLDSVLKIVDELDGARVVDREQEVITFGGELGQEPSHWEPNERNPPIPQRRRPKPQLRSSHRRGR